MSLNYLTDDTFDYFLKQALNEEAVYLREMEFIDPCGMVGVLEVGRFLNSLRMKKRLLLPESEDVLRYLERMDFFKYVKRYFDLDPEGLDLRDKFSRRTSSDVLLEITSIEKSDDIHFIVGRVKRRAHMILERHLHYDDKAINSFIVALSEVCQNIIEHSENTGFVGIQKYHFQNINKNVVKIAVMDLGIGFKKSLGERVRIRDDLEAIDRALFHGISRYAEKGRGHGLAAVRRFVDLWSGKFSIRSGTAKLSIMPEWAKGRERESGLTYFPGAQINIMLPEV
jgi:anti-sigma regulatory factor (Ser/Thr protein kinase)